jgi:hypothetical protein
MSFQTDRRVLRYRCYPTTNSSRSIDMHNIYYPMFLLADCLLLSSLRVWKR